jgi:putative DNA primase/helicase
MSALRAIARALGGDIVGSQVLAPGPGHSAKDRSLSVTLSATAPDGFMAFSHSGDDWRRCRDYVRDRLEITRETPPRARNELQAGRPAAVDRRDDDEKRRRIAASIVDGIVPLRGTPGETYLNNARRIDVDAVADVLDSSDAIGWHPSVLFREDGHPLGGKRLGCIIGITTDPISAKPTGGISRTYLHEGRKLGKAKNFGPAGVVRLTPDEDTLGGLHLAEGLETALTGMSIGLHPMWSAGSTAIMAKMPVIAGIESITVIADNDVNGAGERAAAELVRRWRTAGRETRFWLPSTPGDLNDILMGASP